MKNQKCLSLLLSTALCAGPMLSANQSLAAGRDRTPNTLEKTDAAKTGYEVDGRASASVIAAKRAHSVDRRDEVGLAVYSGVFVIGLILFFTQLFRPRK